MKEKRKRPLRKAAVTRGDQYKMNGIGAGPSDHALSDKWARLCETDSENKYSTFCLRQRNFGGKWRSSEWAETKQRNKR